jgi:midasin
MIKISLDETLESKDLFGSYICTDVPGEFKWEPGALLKALTLGKWILLEDIHLSAIDVVTALIPLVESNSIYISAINEYVQAENGFKLFATAIGTKKSKI